MDGLVGDFGWVFMDWPQANELIGVHQPDSRAADFFREVCSALVLKPKVLI